MASRDIHTVIEQLLEKIPKGRVELINRLNSVKTKTAYCPPECNGYLWLLCSQVLSEEIGKPVFDWEIEVEAIFSGKTPEDHKAPGV